MTNNLLNADQRKELIAEMTQQWFDRQIWAILSVKIHANDPYCGVVLPDAPFRKKFYPNGVA